MNRGRHLIVTLGRSGSNTLVDMLNQNPEVLNFGEVLGDWNRIRKVQKRLGLFAGDDRAYLDALLGDPRILWCANGYRNMGRVLSGRWRETKRMGRIRTVGIKEFSLNFQRYGVMDYIATLGDARIIGLTRANVLERMISNEFLNATGVVLARSGSDPKERRKLRLDPTEVLEKLEAVDAENRVLDELLEQVAPDRLFRLDYRDLYADPVETVATIKRLYAFLGVAEHEPKVRMVKIVARNPLRSLENGAEIRDVVAQSRFARWLWPEDADQDADTPVPGGAI